MKLSFLTEGRLDWIGRISMFVIFFWFGFLKVLMISPADGLVASLLEVTLPSISFEPFFIILGLVEMFIGILFLIPRFTNLNIALLLAHMFTTFGPLVLLPSVGWAGFMTPTIEGQYIIKNLALVALALIITLHHQQQFRKKKLKEKQPLGCFFIHIIHTLR
ncbi:MAG: hypothetical protein P8J32_06655 [bacterium]|jgi:uncharacterized membrane protein YphA (DoxX/SURF4 family)|nr:hypothetical protein [bacterium]